MGTDLSNLIQRLAEKEFSPGEISWIEGWLDSGEVIQYAQNRRREFYIIRGQIFSRKNGGKVHYCYDCGRRAITDKLRLPYCPRCLI